MEVDKKLDFLSFFQPGDDSELTHSKTLEPPTLFLVEEMAKNASCSLALDFDKN